MRTIKIWIIIALFSLLAAACKQPPNTLQAEDLGEINVQFSKPVAQLCKDGQVENQFARLTQPVEPVPATSTDRLLHLYIVRVGKKTKYPDVVEIMKQNGWTPAPLHALVSLAIAKPELLPDHDIAWLDKLPTDALGGVWTGWLGYDHDRKQKMLYARGASFGWSENAWFLVTR